jgi:RND family efflux transporter MFP subunit
MSRALPAATLATLALFAALPGPALSGPAAAEPAARPPALVRVERVALSDYAPRLVLTGAVAARHETPEPFRVSGQIVAQYARVGDHVSAGEVLARLDDSAQQAGLAAAKAGVAAAEAQLAEAKSVYDREARLYAQNLTTTSSHNSAEAAYQSALANRDSANTQLQNAQETLSFTELKASGDGIVTARNFEVGEVAQAGATAFVIAADGARDAVFHAPETVLIGDPIGVKITLSLVSDPTITAPGHVREVSPTIDPATGTVTVKAAIESPPAAMALGAPVVGTALGPPQPRFVLPWSALGSHDGHAALFVVDPETHAVHLADVTVASYQSQRVVISDGISAGDLVVTEGTQLIAPGQVVTFDQEAGQ